MGGPATALNDFFPDENGILALSCSFGVMSLNPSGQQLLGSHPLPGQALPLHQLFADRDLDKMRQAAEDVLKHGTRLVSTQATMLRSDGRPMPCELEVHPLCGSKGRVIGIIFSFIPVRLPHLESPPAHPLDSKWISQISAQGLFDHLPKGSFTIDALWRITAFNCAAEEITGFRREEALGSHCWEIFRSDMCHKQCPMRLAMDRKQPEMDRQVSAVTRHGLRQTLSVNVSLLKDSQGHIAGAVETFHSAGGSRPSPFAEPGRLLEIIGNSPAMRNLFTVLPDLAASQANVLICGESGTGKELVARTLHRLSKHHQEPFVAVNCAALAETLVEAELFGHEKGAFTGAEQSRAGRFELAGRGTLLLDEIGELKPDLQVKLLRVIEQRRFERVGGNRTLRFEARLISSTHQDLKAAIGEKRFREDFYYRLRTVVVTVPPLRERLEDIPLLVDHFIKRFNAKTGKCVRSLDPKVLRHLMAYHWPGNVRELERCIEHAFVFVKGPVIFQRYLPEFEVFKPTGIEMVPLQPGPADRPADRTDRESLLWALQQTGGRRKAAADLLGISRTSVWRRMKALGLD